MVAQARSSRLEKYRMSAVQPVIFSRGVTAGTRIFTELAVRLAMELDGSILRIASEGGLISGRVMGSNPVLQSRDARAVTSSDLLTCSQGRSRSPMILK